MTQPSRSPITNRLAETFPRKYISPQRSLSSFYLSRTLPPAWLISLILAAGAGGSGWPRSPWRGQRSDPAGWRPTRPGTEGGKEGIIVSPGLLFLLTILAGDPPPSSIPSLCWCSDREYYVPPQQAELPSLMIERKPESFSVSRPDSVLSVPFVLRGTTSSL